MFTEKKMKFYSLRNVDTIPQLQKLNDDERFAMKVVANVLPFRTNNYVVEELINWDNVPDDPMFQLTFMQKDLLLPRHFNKMADRSQGKKRAIFRTYPGAIALVPFTKSIPVSV